MPSSLGSISPLRDLAPLARPLCVLNLCTLEAKSVGKAICCRVRTYINNRAGRDRLPPCILQVTNAICIATDYRSLRTKAVKREAIAGTIVAVR